MPDQDESRDGSCAKDSPSAESTWRLSRSRSPARVTLDVGATDTLHVFRESTKGWRRRDRPGSFRRVDTAEVAHTGAMRVAVLADVHGNAVALSAASEEVVAAAPDLLVFLGDVTWGPLPEETWELVRALCDAFTGRTWFVRGNAERALNELRRNERREASVRERWMLTEHASSTLDALDQFPDSAIVDIDGLGPTRFCHGSPRSDAELITPATPSRRMRELLAGVTERVLVTAHAHVQFDRVTQGVRSVNPGSVGAPYQGKPGAYWAILGPDIALRRTEYDVELAVARFRETSDPLVETTIENLLEPPTLREVIAHAEALEFSE
jgi:predicted phosphodiesterase